LIANTEEAMDVPELMKLIFSPPLKLFFRQPAAQKKLTDGMGSRMALLENTLKIGNQVLGGK
jgi:hypothetical protein